MSITTTKKPEFDTAKKSKPKMQYGAAHDLYPLGGSKRSEKSGKIGNIFYVGEGKDKTMVEVFKTEKGALREVEALQNMPGYGKTNPRPVTWIEERKQKTNSSKKITPSKKKTLRGRR